MVSGPVDGYRPTRKHHRVRHTDERRLAPRQTMITYPLVPLGTVNSSV
jgi:hypothetical protein